MMICVKRRTVPKSSSSSILFKNVLKKDKLSSKVFFYYTITNHKPPFKSFLQQKYSKSNPLIDELYLLNSQNTTVVV